jgi:uncharacterized protein YjbI with pentapeptide repeats
MSEVNHKDFLLGPFQKWNQHKEAFNGTIVLKGLHFVGGITHAKGEYDIYNRYFTSVVFEECSFSKVKFSDNLYLFKSSSFQNCKFYGCLFSLKEVYKGFTIASFINCSFSKNSQFVDIHFNPTFMTNSPGNTFLSCNFENCLISGVLKDYEFLGCTIQSTAFLDVAFQNSKLIQNKINGGGFAFTSFDNQCTIDNQDFTGVNITEFSMPDSLWNEIKLTGALFNPDHRNRKSSYGSLEIGLNGIYNRDKGTVALTRFNPKPDSMQGDNPEAIVASLQRARYFMNVSYTMLAIVFLLYFSEGEGSFKFYEVEIPKLNAQLLAFYASIGAIIMSSTFAADAWSGIKYITKQSGAMKVGAFPWMISRYSSHKNYMRLINLIMRWSMCLAPLIMGIIIMPQAKEEYGHWVVTIPFIASAALSIRMIYLSQLFQKPILFDPHADLLES